MNILIPDSWLREFLKTEASPREIQEALSLCSASIERLHKAENDYVYDVEVTTNRVDLMSVVGLAREASAVLPEFKHVAKLTKDPLKSKSQLMFSSKVEYLEADIDPKLCKRFTAILVSGVTVKPSPAKIIKRLELAGMRGLNNVVDISNYLMHQLGQPVHTFDYDKIRGHKLKLRESRKGEAIKTLDGKTHTLLGGDIVIEDGSGELIDLCGIMGGLNSAVDTKTKNVLLFVQTYDPSRIRRTSMSLAHRTQAAVLFEKDLPVENVLPTIEEGVKMFAELTEGKVSAKGIDIINTKAATPKIKLQENLSSFVSSRLGVELTFKQIKNILGRLDFMVLSEKEVEVPFARRVDITIAEDILEEVARVYGYHNLPTQIMEGALPENRPDDKIFYWENKIRSALKHWGFTEVYTYSLVSNDLRDNQETLRLKNPLTKEWEYLRTSIAPSHLKVVSENLGRVGELNLFEIANIYIPEKGNLPNEKLRLAVTTTNTNIFFLKGIIEGLFNYEMGVTVGFNEGREWNMHDHPPCVTFEIDLLSLINKAKVGRTYKPIPKFAPIIEDINIKLRPGQTYSELIKDLKNISDLIQEVDLIDRYNDKLTLRINFLSDAKQLSSQDLSDLREKIATMTN